MRILVANSRPKIATNNISPAILSSLRVWRRVGGDEIASLRGIQEYRRQRPESVREAVNTVGARMLRRSTAGMALLACGLTVCTVVAGASGDAGARQGRAMGLRRGGDRAWGAGVGWLGLKPHRFAPPGPLSVPRVRLGYTASWRVPLTRPPARPGTHTLTAPARLPAQATGFAVVRRGGRHAQADGKRGNGHGGSAICRF